MKNFLQFHFLILFLAICPPADAQIAGTWTEQSTNAQLILDNAGNFQYSDVNTQYQGQFGIQNNIFAMQDTYGNVVQYQIQGFDQNNMVLIDQYGTIYNFVKQNQGNQQQNQGSYQSSPSQQQSNFPWQAGQYKRTLAQQAGQTLTESHIQIYIGFMQLLIGQAVTTSEENQLRQEKIADFRNNPSATINDINQTEAGLKQVYQQNNPQAVAMMREQFFANIYQAVQQNPELQNTSFMQILGNYVQIVSYDPSTGLTLSNRDIAGYINYLMFQQMLAGQQIQLSPEEFAAFQMQLLQQFTSMQVEQKQTIAYASFLWQAIAQQWSSMNSQEQRQYAGQFQQQQGVSASTSNYGSYNNLSNTNQSTAYGEESIDAMTARYTREAASRGITIDQYIDYKQRDMSANNAAFNSIQNMMTESHAISLNIIENMGGGDTYHYVDYDN